jgi:hypothetical protein
MIKKKYIFIFIAVGILLLLLPIILFLIHFGTWKFSTNSDDWFLFGSFFGGVVGTIISFLSLVVLATITIWVSKQGNVESKNLYILKKKMDAYDSLVETITEFANYEDHLKPLNYILKSFNQDSKLSMTYDNLKSEINQAQDITKSFYHKTLKAYKFIFYFKARYSHVFVYNFDSEEYKNLISLFKEFEHTVSILHNAIVYGDLTQSISKDLHIIFDRLVDELVNLMNLLRKEIISEN